MKAREAKKWLRATPTFRPLSRYRQDLDDLVTIYVPRLAGRDVMLPGYPADYDTKEQATEVARKFQTAIAVNHPGIS